MMTASCGVAGCCSIRATWYAAWTLTDQHSRTLRIRSVGTHSCKHALSCALAPCLICQFASPGVLYQVVAPFGHLYHSGICTHFGAHQCIRPFDKSVPPRKLLLTFPEVSHCSGETEAYVTSVPHLASDTLYIIQHCTRKWQLNGLQVSLPSQSSCTSSQHHSVSS